MPLVWCGAGAPRPLTLTGAFSYLPAASAPPDFATIATLRTPLVRHFSSPMHLHCHHIHVDYLWLEDDVLWESPWRYVVHFHPPLKITFGSAPLGQSPPPALRSLSTSRLSSLLHTLIIILDRLSNRRRADSAHSPSSTWLPTTTTPTMSLPACQRCHSMSLQHAS
jgi:hypothetical protein